MQNPRKLQIWFLGQNSKDPRKLQMGALGQNPITLGSSGAKPHHPRETPRKSQMNSFKNHDENHTQKVGFEQFCTGKSKKIHMRVSWGFLGIPLSTNTETIQMGFSGASRGTPIWVSGAIDLVSLPIKLAFN